MKLTPAVISSLSEESRPETLQCLELPKRGITELVGLDNCESLTRLDLSNNEIDNIQDLVANTKLKWLNLKGNRLESFEPILFHTNLQVLNLSHNKLSSLSGIGKIPQLKALIVNDNTISDIRPVERLRELNTLVLSNNVVEDLGSALKHLTSLSKLSLSHNKLQSLGTALRNCYELTELRVAHNRLKAFPDTLLHNSRLKILDAGGNSFREWKDIEVLSSLPELVNLNLHGSALSKEESYTQKIIEAVPGVQVLDSHRVKEKRQKGRQRRDQAAVEWHTSSEEVKGTKGTVKIDGEGAKPAKKPAVKQDKDAAKKPLESEPEQSFLATVLTAQQGNPKPSAGIAAASQKSGVVSVVTRTNRPPSGKKAFAVGAAAAKELLGLEAGGPKVGGATGLGLGAGWDAPIVVGSSESSSVPKVTESQPPDTDKPATGIKRKSAAEGGAEDKSVASLVDKPRSGGHPADATPNSTTPTPKKKGRWALKASTG